MHRRLYVAGVFIYIVACLVLYRAVTATPTLEGFEFTQAPVCNDTYYLEVDGFLTPEQCDALIAATQDVGLNISQVGIDASVTDESVRKSTQHWFKPEDNDIAKYIRQKTIDFVNSLGCMSNTSANTYDDIQVVRYDVGGKYDPHYDDDECETDTCKPNRRIATLLIYLNDDFKGGTTRFPNLDVDVVPKKGKALFFWVADPSTTLLYKNTLHGGMAVESGQKWIATQWIRTSAQK